MIQYIVPLIVSWMPIFNSYLIYYLAAIIIAFVPVFVYSIFKR